MAEIKYGYGTSPIKAFKYNEPIIKESLMTEVTNHPDGDTSTTYYPMGIVVSPIRPSNGKLACTVYPWDMGINGGQLKQLEKNYAANSSHYGYRVDGTFNLYNSGYYLNNYVHLGLALYTNNTPDGDGFITLYIPIKISLPLVEGSYLYDFTEWVVNPNQPSGGISVTDHTITITKFKPNEWFIRSNYSDTNTQAAFTAKFTNKPYILEGLNSNLNYPVDPTTIEGFKAALGSITAYNKPKDFANTFVEYGIANVETVGEFGHYRNAYYVVSGSAHSELTSSWDYYICNGGNWPNKYARLRYPYPVDLQQMVTDGFPVKFSFTQYDINENGFWNSLYNTMETTEIKDSYWASALFSGSNVPMMKLIFNPEYGTDNGTTVVQKQNAVLDCCFDHCANLKSATLVRKGDTKTFNTLANVFRNCYSLSSVTFESVDSNGSPSNVPWRVGQLSGTFEFCGNLKTWPNNFIISNTQYDSTCANEQIAHINFTFEGSGFPTIGSGEEFKVGLAQQCFNSAAATTVNCTLDMRYVHPNIYYHTYRLFGDNSNINSIRLKNINHNSWYFDSTKPYTEGSTSWGIGKCSQFDQTSVEYLFHNLYDLTSNALEENILKRKPTIDRFNSWTTGGTGVTIQNDTNVRFSRTNGTLSISSVNGKFFKFTVSNMASGEQLTVTDGITTKTITSNGNYYIDIAGTSCTITANAINSSHYVNVQYITSWDGAVSNVTASTLYCPADWDDSSNNRVIDDEMVIIATNRGWMVRVDNKPHTVRIETSVAKNQLEVDETTTATVYLVRTRDNVETRTNITNSPATIFHTTDSSVVDIDSNGIVSGKSAGSASIYAEYSGLTSNNVLVSVDTPIVTTYRVVASATTNSIAYNGTTDFAVYLEEYANGVLVDTTNVTSASTISSTGSVTATTGQTVGTITGNNATNYDTTGSVTATYSSSSSTINMNVAAKPIYELEVTANPTTISYSGQTTLSAVYKVILNGTTASTTSVNATYSTTSQYGSISGNKFNANNTSDNDQTVRISGTYNNGVQNVTGSTDITVECEPKLTIIPASFIDVTPSGITETLSVTVNGGQGWYVDNSTLVSWIHISPTGGSGSQNITLTIDANASRNTRPMYGLQRVWLYGTVEGGDWIEISQKGVDAPKLTDVTMSMYAAPDIPASGGKVNSSSYGLGYYVYAHYSDGTTEDVTSDASISTVTEVSAGDLGTNETVRTNVGTLELQASYLFNTATATRAIYQEANVMTTWTETGTTPSQTSAWTSTTTTTYSIDVSPSSNSVASGSGSFNTTVDAVATSTYTAYTRDYHYNTSTPWSGFTSGAEISGPTSTGSTKQWEGSTQSDAHTSTASTAYSSSSDSNWLTASGNRISYTTNNGSQRSGIVTYTVNADTSKTDTCEVTQNSAPIVVVTGLTVALSNVPTIPASGGVVNCSDITYTVTAKYSNGTSRQLDNEEYDIVDCDPVSVGSRGTNIDNSQTTAGTLDTEVSFGDVYQTASTVVKQERNQMRTWNETGTTEHQSSAWTSTTATTYSIDVTPSSTGVTSGAGSFNTSVESKKIDSWTAYTRYYHYNTTTPWSGFTSGVEISGKTSTGTTKQWEGSGPSATPKESSASTAYRASSDSNWLTGTTGSSSSISYSANGGQERTGTVTYTVNADTGETATCEVAQAEYIEPTRDLRISLTGWRISNVSPTISSLGNSISVAVIASDVISGGTAGETNPITAETSYGIAFSPTAFTIAISTTATSVDLNVTFQASNTTGKLTLIQGTSASFDPTSMSFSGGEASTVMKISNITAGTSSITKTISGIVWELGDN